MIIASPVYQNLRVNLRGWRKRITTHLKFHDPIKCFFREVCRDVFLKMSPPGRRRESVQDCDCAQIQQDRRNNGRLCKEFSAKTQPVVKQSALSTDNNPHRKMSLLAGKAEQSLSEPRYIVARRKVLKGFD